MFEQAVTLSSAGKPLSVTSEAALGDGKALRDGSEQSPQKSHCRNQWQSPCQSSATDLTQGASSLLPDPVGLLVTTRVISIAATLDTDVGLC